MCIEQKIEKKKIEEELREADTTKKEECRY
jgi:hypothetical protein